MIVPKVPDMFQLWFIPSSQLLKCQMSWSSSCVREFTYVAWRYMLIMDISCQHLEDECKLEGFCVSFGYRFGECTFSEIYICIGYMMPTIWWEYVTWRYMLILDISCQTMGDECKLEGFCVPFGHRVGECTYLEIYICIGYMMPTIWGTYVTWRYRLIMDISCQNLEDECKLEGFCVPFGHKVGDCTILEMYNCIG